MDRNSVLSAFKSENWQKLEGSKKLEAFQNLENYMASMQGREAREVRIKNLGENIAGRYDFDEPGFLTINDGYIYDNKLNQFDGMETIIHEGRHAYQDDNVSGKIFSKESDETLSSWEQNGKEGHYLEPKENNLASGVDYRFQPVENDANNYANEQMKSFGDVLGKDANYNSYMKDREDCEDFYKQTAESIYGQNYEEKIAEKVKKGNVHDDNKDNKADNNEKKETENVDTGQTEDQTNGQASDDISNGFEINENNNNTLNDEDIMSYPPIEEKTIDNLYDESDDLLYGNNNEASQTNNDNIEFLGNDPEDISNADTKDNLKNTDNSEQSREEDIDSYSSFDSKTELDNDNSNDLIKQDNIDDNSLDIEPTIEIDNTQSF